MSRTRWRLEFSLTKKGDRWVIAVRLILVI